VSVQRVQRVPGTLFGTSEAGIPVRKVCLHLRDESHIDNRLRLAQPWLLVST